jgi:hypothetical protein
MVVFFIVGIALVFGSIFYFIVALRSTLGGDPTETVDFVRSYQVPWFVMTIVGSSLVILASLLAVYWAYLKHKIQKEQAFARDQS